MSTTTTRWRPTPTAGGSAAALALILAFMVAEVVAGLIAGSLALLSDAAHMLTDAASLALALVAARLAARPPSGRFTFGLGRAEVLSAQVNGAALLVLAGVIAIEAVQRFSSPPDVEGGVVLVVGLLGAAVNVAAAWQLAQGGAALAQRRGRARPRADRPLRVAGRRRGGRGGAAHGLRARPTRSPRCWSPR